MITKFLMGWRSSYFLKEMVNKTNKTQNFSEYYKAKAIVLLF